MDISKWLTRRAARTFKSVYRRWVPRIFALTPILLLTAPSLSACNVLRTRIDSAETRQREQLSALVQFAANVRTLDEFELQQNYRMLQTEYRTSPSSDTAVKLSLLLSYSEAPPDALVEALQLLNDLSDDDTDHSHFAQLIYDLISERYAATASNGALTDLLLQERNENRRIAKKLAASESSLAASQRQRAALAQQLNALKAVEEQIRLHDNGSQRLP